MARVEILFYCEANGRAPLAEWFDQIRPTARARCLAHLKHLEEMGHELERPGAALLRKGIYELRVKDERVHYRLLYFFYGRTAVVVSHGFVKKEARVPETEIKRALRRRALFEANPELHTFRS